MKIEEYFYRLTHIEMYKYTQNIGILVSESFTNIFVRVVDLIIVTLKFFIMYSYNFISFHVNIFYNYNIYVMSFPLALILLLFFAILIFIPF